MTLRELHEEIGKTISECTDPPRSPWESPHRPGYPDLPVYVHVQLSPRKGLDIPVVAASLHMQNHRMFLTLDMDKAIKTR